MTLDADVKGDAYEGLLAKNAEDVKTGAGQYFTPRPLIRAIVDVMRPTASMRVCDPAAGTGGFLLAAYEQMKSGSLDPDQKRFLRDDALRGWEIVDATARLCAMNLLLHGIGAPESPSLITVDDSLRSTPSDHFDMVLTNPPFGKKSSYKVINAEGETEREDDELPPRGLLGDHLQQAAQLPPARPVAARRSTAAPPSSCPTTSCSRAARARRSGGGCWSSATCTPSCGCRPASSTPAA